jgi:hypothetical protein
MPEIFQLHLKCEQIIVTSNSIYPFANHGDCIRRLYSLNRNSSPEPTEKIEI